MAGFHDLYRTFRDQLRKPRQVATSLMLLMWLRERRFQMACSQLSSMLPDRRRGAPLRYICFTTYTRSAVHSRRGYAACQHGICTQASHQDHTDVAALVRRTRSCDAQRPEMRRRGGSPGTARTSWQPRRRRPPRPCSPQPQSPSQLPPPQVVAAGSGRLSKHRYTCHPLNQPAAVRRMRMQVTHMMVRWKI